LHGGLEIFVVTRCLRLWRPHAYAVSQSVSLCLSAYRNNPAKLCEFDQLCSETCLPHLRNNAVQETVGISVQHRSLGFATCPGVISFLVRPFRVRRSSPSSGLTAIRHKVPRYSAATFSSVTIAAIASALGVPEPHAADIREGRRRPHRRHWHRLAQLVGYSL